MKQLYRRVHLFLGKVIPKLFICEYLFWFLIWNFRIETENKPEKGRNKQNEDSKNKLLLRLVCSLFSPLISSTKVAHLSRKRGAFLFLPAATAKRRSSTDRST